MAPKQPPISSCPSCLKSWQDQAEFNLRAAAALEAMALRIAELTEVSNQGVARIEEIEKMLEFLQEQIKEAQK